MKVTPETYIRAETDRQFGIVGRMAGGVNRFFHFRRPTLLDQQNIVRMLHAPCGTTGQVGVNGSKACARGSPPTTSAGVQLDTHAVDLFGQGRHTIDDQRRC